MLQLSSLSERIPLSTKQIVNLTIEVDSIAGHIFAVTQRLVSPPEGLTLSLPAWIPGSYMIRDFAKNLGSFRAYDQRGKPLAYSKPDKQTWLVEPCDGEVTISYQIYAFDFSVRSAFITDEYAFCNGTSMFLLAKGYEQASYALKVVTPVNIQPQWRVATGLQPDIGQSDVDAYHFLTDSYADLIDNPIILGQFDSARFEVNGVQFESLFAGGHHTDIERINQDLQRICRHHLALFGTPYPIEKYLFITLLSQNSFGGLEHGRSTVLQFSRGDLPHRLSQQNVSDGYRTFLSLCSHELFHTWHVKRTRPQEFIPLDLSREVYTEQLWIYEGFTSYMDDLSLVRSQLISPDSYLELLGITLTRLERNTGKDKQTVTESSFDAWTRFYQQDASAPNNIVSYYSKGAVIALCLDLLIRQHSNHQYSLFNVLQILWQQYGSKNIGTPVDVIQQIISKELNLQLEEFFQLALYSTSPLPTESLLSSVGVAVHLRARIDSKDKGGKAAENISKIDFGASFAAAPTGVRITQVLEGRAAYAAGLQVDDQLIAIDQWEITQTTLHSVLDNFHATQAITLHVLRDGKLKNVSMPVRQSAKDTVFLTTIEQQKRDQWLMQPSYITD